METLESNATLADYVIYDDLNGPSLAVAVGLEFLISLVINSGVLLATFTQPSSLKKPATIFLSFLVGANLILTIFFMPFTVISAAMSEWIFGSTDPQKQVVCQAVGFMFALSVGLSTYTLALISVDRFLFIVKPLLYIRFMNAKVALIIVACLYPLIILANVTPFFGFGSFEYSRSTSSCLPLWLGNSDYVLYFSLASIIPYSTIIITSVWTFVYTRQFLQRRRESNKSSYPFNNEQEKMRDSAYNHKVCNLIGIFGSLLIAHLVSLSPYITASIIGFIVGYDNVPSPVYATALVLYLLNAITISLIQAYFRPELRKILIRIWYVMSFCGRQSEEDGGMKYNTVPSPHASTNTNETNDTVDINV